uniref:SDR family oxidoreductase n=1 Tax=Fervidobacterium thailandense TaxID=1008305 RepID=A0A7C4VTA9_9BACT
MSKVLVTGGAGFIGSHVTDKLVELGHEVVVVDNLSTGKRENVNPKVRFYKIDISDGEAIFKLFAEEKFEYVFHLAAQASVAVSVKDPVKDAMWNIVGSLNLIKASVESGVKKFIFSSTGGAIYGEDVKIFPTPESVFPQPMSPYGIAKFTVENYLRFFGKEFDLNYTILRYGNVYGPRQDPYGEAGVVAIFTQRMLKGEDCTIFGDGEYVRDYIYVEDVVDANIKAMERGDKQVLNIGTATGTTTNELFKILKKLTGYKKEPVYGPHRKGDIRKSVLCYNRAWIELKWEPKYSLEEGLRKTVEWFKRNLTA